MHYMT